jgi:uncharacterized surface protein with fasciclin (FAS1) repeats
MRFIAWACLLSSVVSLALPQLGTIEEKPRTSDTLLNAIKEFQANSPHRFAFLSSLISASRTTIDGFTVPENYQLTIFVPSDAAFTTIPLNLLSDAKKLFNLVSYHVVPKTVNVTAVEDAEAFKTFSDDDIIIEHQEESDTPYKANVISKLNSKASVIGSVTIENLVAVFVDNLLQPPVSLAQTAQELEWSALVSLLKIYKPRPTIAKLRDFTVFVPSEEAIASFVAQCGGIENVSEDAVNAVVDNHIYPGSVLYEHTFDSNTTSLLMASNQTLPFIYGDDSVAIGTANITGPQYLISGGVAHVVNSVNVPEGIAVCKTA